MQYPQDNYRSRTDSIDAIDGQIRQTGNHQLSCARRSARPAAERKLIEPLHSFQYPPPDRRSDTGGIGRDPLNDAKEIIIRWLGPSGSSCSVVDDPIEGLNYRRVIEDFSISQSLLAFVDRGEELLLIGDAGS